MSVTNHSNRSKAQGRSRREFIAAAGLSLAAAGAAHAKNAPSEPKKPLIIDCQSHLFCPQIVALMEKRKNHPVVYRKGNDRYVQMGDWHRRILPTHFDVVAKLSDMDASGISMTALSINDPGPEWFGSDGSAVAQTLNDYITGVVKQHPTRFFGLCVLPLPDMRSALKELDRCIRELEMKGILLYTNIAGRFPDEPQFRSLFARAVELDVPVLLHPALPVTSDQVKGYEMISSLGNMFDDTIALTRLILSGLLDEFPKLKLVCPHLGGTLPYIIGRIDHQIAVLKRGPQNLKRTPSEYLRQCYLDIVSPMPLAMRFGHDFMGADRLLFGSDHPWVDPRLILDGLRSLKLPSEDERKILGGNAKKIFGIADQQTDMR